MPQRKNKAVLGILIVVFLSFVLLMIFASYTMKNLKSDDASFNVGSFGKKGSIAVVEVNGVIMESKNLIELIHQAENDKGSKAIIIRINSPGGAVGPTQEVYEEIRRIDSAYDKSEGKEGKPIYASFGTIAASGGYYLGAATRRIYSNPGTLTGSIGVIMQFMDLSRLYEFAMVNQQNIKSGRYKDIGQPNRAITVEEKALLEGVISGVHQQFMKDVLRTRKSKIKGDLNELAQGQIFSGEQAFNFGLVDDLSSLWQAGRKIHEELKLEGEFGFKFIEKKKKSGIWALMDNLDEAVTNLRILSTKLSNSSEAPAILFK
ncbi:MAG: signal peptide peptidase SppA [Bacteriovoracaceae bacterium]|nr:signal peptide peptidase SppA [Bacteriovoracaceae bacterium]